jgi:hypothetical protein
VQATTLEGNALDLLFLTADTELGEVYIDGAGKLVFRNRLAILTDTRSNTSQATFGDSGSELPYHDITPVYDHTKVRNLIRATRVGGSQQTVSDAASQEQYLVRHRGPRRSADGDRRRRRELGELPAVPEQGRRVPVRRDGDSAVDGTGDVFPEVLGRQLGDRITVRRRPPGGGDPIERDVFIRGITHDIGPGSWITKWALQSATKFAFLTLDNTSLGTLDSNALAY